MENTPVINPATYAVLEKNLAEILPELKAAFIEDGFLLLNQIKESIPNNNTKIIIYAAHTLKSSSQNIGADTLADYCIKMETDSSLNKTQLTDLYQKSMKEMQTIQAFFDSTG